MTTTTIYGLVATTPRHLVTHENLAITSFRLAEMNLDESQETNWYTVIAYKHLATTIANTIQKGDRIMVEGTLKIRDWDNGEMTGTTVEVEAKGLGLDLNFTRNIIAPNALPTHTCNCSKCDK